MNLYFEQMNNDKTPTIREIEYCIRPGAEPQKVFDILTRLKYSTPTEDDAAGAKLFLENNNYDLDKLRLFIEKSKRNVFSNPKVKLPKKEKQKTNVFKLKSLTKVAASIAVIIIAGLLTFKLSDFNQDKKFAQFEIEESGLPVFMSDDTDVSFDEFMSSFKKEEFKTATKLGESLNQNDSVLYFLGVSYYKTKDYQLALQNLELVSESSKFKPESNYFSALIHWRNNNLKQAKILFNELQAHKELGPEASKAIMHKDFEGI
jgi:hypothetical protein